MRRSLTVLIVFAVLTAGCSSTSGPPVRVLFVGNSYTHFNDLPAMVRDLGASAGRKVEVEMRAPGGWWWRDHAGSSETLDAIGHGHFDYVILQEQSMAPAVPRMAETESYPAANQLKSAASLTGANVILFMTWGHQSGSAEIGLNTYSSMQVALADAYALFGDALPAEVAPVGQAWWMARAERPGIVLYQADGSHPSVEGSYLAAVVITASLLDIDANTLDNDLGVDEIIAGELRGFAARAVNGEVPWGP